MKILVHVCCANCAIYPVKVLREQNHEVTGFFFNNNIHPFLEFKRRLDTVKEYATQTELPIVYREEYLLEEFLAEVSANPGSRCSFCYESRLEEAARFASEKGYEAFTTSLLYSRFQNHAEICRIGETLGQRYGVRFLYQDFRKGWKEGIEISKSMGLYRQQYCGCIYSEKDRYHPRNTN